MSRVQEDALAKQFYDVLQKDAAGISANIKYKKSDEEHFRNIPIETLICDDYFLGLKDEIYPRHLEDIIELWEDRKHRPVNLVLLEESIGCVVGDTWIYTPEGPMQIKDLCKDEIIGEHAWESIISVLTPTDFKQTSHCKKTNISKVIKIRSKFGYTLSGTLDHPVEVVEEGNIIAKKLSEIKEGDFVGVDVSIKPFGNYPLDPQLGYLMGYLIGDGHIKENFFIATMHEDDVEMALILKPIMEKYFDGCIISQKNKRSPHLLTLRSRAGKISDFIRKYNLNKLTPQKIVPDQVFKSSEETIKEFLRGLFDADGSFHKNRFSISAKNRELLDGVQLLLLMFGIICRVSLKNCTYQRGKTTCWRLNLSGKHLEKFEQIGFNLTRKNNKLKAYLSQDIIRNTNYDIIPNILDQVKSIVKSVPHEPVGFERYKIYKTYIAGRENFSKSKLSNFLKDYKNTRDQDNWKRLADLIDYSSYIVWLPVVEIEEDEDQVCYDFTVPETGNFIANGIASKNSGKSMVASILTWLQWYEVSTYYNPQQSLGLADGSTIAFMTFSRSEVQSKRVIFSDVFKRFQTPFNKDYFPPNPRFSKEIQIEQNNTVVYAGTSSGLCISYDQEIYIDKVNTAKIGELVSDKPQEILGFNLGKQEPVITGCDFVKNTGEKEVFEVEFENGSIIKCTKDHKFLIYKEIGMGKKIYQYKRLEDIDINEDEIEVIYED